MHTGSDMGGPVFSSRRPNAPNHFELPPPPLSSGPKYQYAVSGSQGGQAPGTLASVGNLLTPPSTIGGVDVTPSPTGNAHTTSSAPPTNYSNGAYAWSPSTTHNTYYAPPQQSNQQFQQQQRVPYSPASVRGHPNSPQSSESSTMGQPYDLPQYSSAGPMTPVTVPTLAPQPQAHSHHQLQSSIIGSTTPVSSAGPHPSPVHAQEAFRPPPTPTYYSQQNTPQQSAFPFTTGPSPAQMTLASTGPIPHRPQMSPASSGSVPPLPAPAVQSPHAMQGQFARHGYGPVMSNIHNPNGQPMLVGAMPHGLVHGFNSGHAAALQMYGSPAPQSQPQNDRPFKCDQCPQSFNRNHDLKRHKRIHLAVKPFPCGHCDKSFSRKDALKRHVLVKGCGKPDAVKEEAAEVSSPPAKSVASDTTDAKPTTES